jgi:hypothetical protein
MKACPPSDRSLDRAASGRAVSDGDRAARLKAALKANIARRKQQARARAAAGEDPDAADDNEAGTGADRSERG